MSKSTILLSKALLFILPAMLWTVYLAWSSDLNFDPEAAKTVNAINWHLQFGETAYWYLFINLGAFFFPFVLSFDRKVHFYKKWCYLFPAIGIVGAFFLIWDVYFTHLGVWGFNQRYYSATFCGLPIGEWLFFVTVPYACVFIYECLICYFPKDPIAQLDKVISYSLISVFFLVGILGAFQLYTSWTFLLAGSFLLFHVLYIPNTYRTQFYIAYLISLIPFILVNGILTGAVNEAPVVLYNNEHNLMNLLHDRFVTIPFDDFIYSFLLIIMNITLYEGFRQKRKKAYPSTAPAQKQETINT